MDASTKAEITEVLAVVYKALEEKGYNPVHQLCNYLLSEDPQHITTLHNARNLMSEISQDDLGVFLLEHYFNK